MNTNAKLAIVAALAVAIAVAVVVKNQRTPASTPPALASAVQTNRLPKLLDLGATKCIPCKLMAPILEELRREQTGRLEVVFIDVWENVGAGKQYGVEAIPTQIFYDAGGKELFRHTGFFSKSDILAKWKDVGVELSAGAPVKSSGKPQ